MAVDKARETALKILYEINEQGAYSNIAVKDHISDEKLSGIDRAFISELVYGTICWKLTLDWIIRKYSTVKFRKISPWVLNILRMGIYQLVYLDKVPPSAAVNESVNLARKYGHKGSVSFVNGLLRNIARQKDSINFSGIKDTDELLSVKYSHPQPLVRKLLKLYGRDFTEQLLMVNNSSPEFTIRVNTLKTTREELINNLNERGYKSVMGKYSNNAIQVENPGGLVDSDLHRNGFFQVQDESSMLAVEIMDPKPGMTVIDVCSAPGGKTSYMAQLMENKGFIHAGDIYPHRMELVQKNAERLGITIINTYLLDAAKTFDKFVETADRVLVDVPCSGLGILRRKPDIKWTVEFDRLSGLSELQYQILKSSSAYVKPGGVLVYSTCTIMPEENQQVVKKFVSENQGFEFDDIKKFLPGKLTNYAEKGYIQLFPNRDGIDGFFICRMVKKS